MLLRTKLFTVAAGIVASAALFSGTALADSATTQAVTPSADVTIQATTIPVPGNYVYNPSLGSLHDYCTSSPDSFGSADFRGPCARHDMCYEAPGQHKSACDSELKAGITNNCVAAYPGASGACNAAGLTYYAAVVAFGDDPPFAPSGAAAAPATSEQQDVAAFAPRN